MKRLISFLEPRLCYSGVTIDCGPCDGIDEGITAITGPNGSGKSTLGLALAKGRHCFNNRMAFHHPDLKIKLIEFCDIHNWGGIDVDYAAQRLEATMNEFVPTVSDILGRRMLSDRWHAVADRLGLHGAADKKINYLSSGEQRKLLLVNAITESPDILVLDNPYIGLDASTRAQLDYTLQQLRADGVSVVMLLCDETDIPQFTDTLITIDNRHITSVTTDPASIRSMREHVGGHSPVLPSLPEPPGYSSRSPHKVSFAITGGRLTYGGRDIIARLDWEVKAGERWALCGPNGSGKSLLLSVVCAESPQAYSNAIVQFDRPRGSGESIWEIKDRIGYVSPEMQVYFRSMQPVAHIVARGGRSTLNRYRPVTREELALANQWLSLLGIGHLAQNGFGRLSAGEKRLVMLARVLLKQPELMVLDEPFHGLDSRRKHLCRNLVSEIADRNSVSLIFVSHYDSEFPKGLTRRLSLPDGASSHF